MTLRTCCTLLAVIAVGVQAHAAGVGGEGIVTPRVLPPFDAAAAKCEAPNDLKRELVFAQDNRRDFMQGVARGLELAAKHRGLGYKIVLADNDAARMSEQVKAALADKAGALVAAPVDPHALASDLKDMIWAGAYVGTIVPPPAVSILNAPQYLSGRVLARAAAAHIRTVLGGKARVVLLTHDNLEPLAPRFVAMRDVLNELPDAQVIADISPATVDKQGGLETMRLILSAHPDVDVVLGADTVVLGALQALREIGKDRPNQFLGGIDGEAEAVAEIKTGGPYKASVSLASPIFAYAMGQHAADWLDGKSIPQAMDILPMVLTKENVAQYETDIAQPDLVYADAPRRAQYLAMYGNICFATRDQFLNFPWSSEHR